MLTRYLIVGFSVKPTIMPPRRLEHAELHPDVLGRGRHGQRRPGQLVLAQQVAEVQIGEHVAVHHHEVLGQPIAQPEQRPDGGQRNEFLRVVDLDAPAAYRRR